MFKDVLKIIGSILTTALGATGMILLVGVLVELLPKELSVFIKIMLGMLLILISMIVGGLIKIKSENLF
ncbi:MAG: hypothetical protein ACE5KD_00470 [Candidatus Bathyarchaeia archaeon]